MGNIRYIKQPDTYGCGPTAILNTLKWAGVRATLKTHYRALVKRCKAKDDDHELSGTHIYDFENTLKYVSQKRFSIQKINWPKIHQIEKELKSGNIVILLHVNHDWSTHYSLIIGTHQDIDFIGVNAFLELKSVSTVPRPVMKFWTKKNKNLPIAWVISKI